MMMFGTFRNTNNRALSLGNFLWEVADYKGDISDCSSVILMFLINCCIWKLMAMGEKEKR